MSRQPPASKDIAAATAAFVISNEAWYTLAVAGENGVGPADILISLRDPEALHSGGVYGEFAVRWHHLGDDAPTPRLEIFADAWPILGRFEGFFEGLRALDDNADPVTVSQLLEACGVIDLTERHDRSPGRHRLPSP